MHRPAKIGYLDLAMYADKDVLWLDVPMHDMFLVQVFQGRSHLGDILRRFPFREATFFAQMLVQFTFAGKLEDQEHSLAVVKMAEEPEDVGMSQVGLDLDFSSDLFFHLALLQL